MVYAAFICLLLGASVCFGTGGIAPARLLGLGATLFALVAAALIVAAPLPTPGAEPLTLIQIGSASFVINAGLDMGERTLALALLGGGGAALLALAGAIAPAVRGFGAIFAWGLITLAACLLSLAAPPFSLAQPLAWAVLSIAGYASLRASGTTADETPPQGLIIGLLASTVLAGGLLATGVAPGASDALPAWPAALCGLVAALGIAGSPPLAGARTDLTTAPAPLGALVMGLAAPAAGLSWLIRAVALLPTVPELWALVLGLVGGLGALACGAGALGVHNLRTVLAWVTAGQAAAVVAATGLAGPLAAVAGPGLLLTLLLAATGGAVAVATLERTSGSDDYTAAGVDPPRTAGAIWALAGAAALGLPPLWGFWPRLWLLQAAHEQQPWLLAPLFAGLVLTTLAVLAPLARLLTNRSGTTPGWADTLPAVIVILPLLVLGVAPGLAWATWLQSVPFAPADLPATQGALIAVVGAGLTLAVLATVAVLARPARVLPRDPDEAEVQLAPDALGASLRPLAWLAHPEPLLRGAWEGLRLASEGLRLLIGLFEQRYYLLGILGALLTIMLLMAQ